MYVIVVRDRNPIEIKLYAFKILSMNIYYSCVFADDNIKTPCGFRVTNCIHFRRARNAFAREAIDSVNSAMTTLNVPISITSYVFKRESIIL